MHRSSGHSKTGIPLGLSIRELPQAVCLRQLFEIIARLTLCLGSIYVLMIISLQGLRYSLGSAAGTLATDLGNLMRWPDGMPLYPSELIQIG